VDAGVGASYLWNFGTGSSPATANTIGPFNVTYNTSGTKTASLTVTDANNCTSTETLSFSAVSSALPLLLLSFTAQPQGANVVLNWETADALNVSSFSIERSLDGINYSIVGSVAFSPFISVYSFTDANILPANGNLYYYRLITIDNDGNFDYSSVRIVKFAGMSNQLTASPNPFTNKLTVAINIARNESSVSIKLIDNSGGTIMTKKFTGLTEGHQLLQINGLGYLSSGMYIVEVQPENNQLYHIKVMKQ
jgi:PKD repeat protein